MKELENKNYYPDEETPLLDHYSDFDNVYVGLLPFFKIDKTNCDYSSSKKVISLEEAREKEEIFKKIGNYPNVTIYSSNDCYPSDEEIQSGTVIKWSEIIRNTEIENSKELNKALMTSIGAYIIAINERIFSKQDIEKYFEGFWATEDDSHLWAWEKGEIDRLLNSENENHKEIKWWQQCINTIVSIVQKRK